MWPFYKFSKPETMHQAIRDRPPSGAAVEPALPPGPHGPALFHAFRLWLRPLEFMDECRQRYGSSFTIRLPGFPPDVFFSEPDAVREILGADSALLRAGEGNLVLEPVLGRNSLLLLDGARHLRERRLLMPPFHGERMHHYGELIREIAVRTIEAWPEERPFPAQREMQKITLEVILRAVFGIDEGETLARMRAGLGRYLAVATSPFVFFRPTQVDLGPLSPWGKFVRVRREVHDLFIQEIRRRRANGIEGRTDILSMLLAARDEDGEPLTEADLHDQMMTLLLAGHETTATALAWAFHHLDANPEVLGALREELDGAAENGAVPVRRMGELELLDATVKETLRLVPVVPEIGRKIAKSTWIGGRYLPAGAVVAPSIYLVHRDPRVWPEPERFRPERFIGLRPSPYEFLPFGGGIRRCIGAAFALYEMRIVLGEIVSRVDFRRASRRTNRVLRRGVTLAPWRGMPITIRRRSVRA